MFRLRGLDFPQAKVQRPQYFGHLTNDIVYKRLAPGVLDELRKVTPRDDKGRRKHKYFQQLQKNVGYPKLTRASWFGRDAHEAKPRLAGLPDQTRPDPPASRRHHGVAP